MIASCTGGGVLFVAVVPVVPVALSGDFPVVTVSSTAVIESSATAAGGHNSC